MGKKKFGPIKLTVSARRSNDHLYCNIGKLMAQSCRALEQEAGYWRGERLLWDALETVLNLRYHSHGPWTLAPSFLHVPTASGHKRHPFPTQLNDQRVPRQSHNIIHPCWKLVASTVLCFKFNFAKQSKSNIIFQWYLRLSSYVTSSRLRRFIWDRNKSWFKSRTVTWNKSVRMKSIIMIRVYWPNDCLLKVFDTFLTIENGRSQSDWVSLTWTPELVT